MRTYYSHRRHTHKQARSTYNPYYKSCFNTYATVSGERAHVHFNVPVKANLSDFLDDDATAKIMAVAVTPPGDPKRKQPIALHNPEEGLVLEAHRISEESAPAQKKTRRWIAPVAILGAAAATVVLVLHSKH